MKTVDDLLKARRERLNHLEFVLRDDVPDSVHPKYALMSPKSYYEIMQDPPMRHMYDARTGTVKDLILIPSSLIPDDQLEIR